MDIKKEYERWLENATADANVAAELKTLDNAKIEDAFYRDLAFGTGGLRGVIGAGTNRMNIYTVAKASQGLADYLKKNFAEPSVAIGYDSRIKSDVFAKVAAGVFAANGVKVNIWPVLMPVPTVSFATRYLHTSAGVMVTASHNPSKYNGYKVYGADGCQITTEAAAEILAEIEKLDIFADVKHSNFETGLVNGSIQYIPDEVYTAFVNEVKNQSVLFGEEVNAIEEYNLNPFEMKVQGIDRTLADKVFAVCDYYLQGKVAKHSRHLYDIYKLLPLVPQDENFKELVKEVRAVREQSVICPSALPEANVPELLEKIIKEKAYKQDYDSLTTQLLEENVPYDTVIATLKKVAESSIFENN